MDDQGDGAEPVRIMTYRDLAAALGIDQESAQRRAQRRKWRRMRGNDGKARVAVPTSVIPDAPTDGLPNNPADNGGTVPSTGASALAPLLLDLAAQARAAREALDTARAERDTACAEVTAIRGRAAVEITEAQKQATEETAEARERAAKAEGEAVALRLRVDQAEQRVNQSEAREAAERARAERSDAECDRLRIKLEAWMAGGPLARAWRAFLNRQVRS
jgi:hypothetical protein